jgi:3',5'-cyclic AMP phosphodiesterase CpdA
MEHKLITRVSLLLTITYTISACSKYVDFPAGKSVNQRFEQSLAFNSSHTPREIHVMSDDYSVLSMGDSHVGSTKNLDSFIHRGNEIKCSALVMVGDLTTGLGHDYSIFEQHLPDQDSLPSFLIAGNHDLFSNGWEEFYYRFGSTSYFFTIKTPEATDLFICLDTGSGTLGDKQLNWLKNLLQTLRPGYRHCMVFTHNNLLRPRHIDTTNPLIEEMHVLFDLFTEYHVDMVITGHEHKHNATVFGKTTYIIMDALKDGFENSGYFKISVNRKAIDYSFEYI